MKKLWKLALVAVFALVLAIPMALTGCGTEKFTVNFETVGVFRQGEGYQVSATPFGNVDTNKVTGVKQGSKFSVNGNTLTIGGKTVTATPIDSSRNTDAYTYQFKEWRLTSFDETSDEDITTKKVASNIIVKAVFERVDAVYTVTFDTNGVDVGQELPTIQVTYGTAIAAEQLPNIDVAGYTLKTSSGNNGATGWSIDKNATLSADTLGKQTTLKPGELEATYRTAMNYTAQAGLTEDDFYNGINEEGKRYYKKINQQEYTEVTTFEEGTTYYEGVLKHTNVETNIDYVNKTITLYAVWDVYYVGVRLYQYNGTYQVTTKNNTDTINAKSVSWEDDLAENLKVELHVVGSDVVYDEATFGEDYANEFKFYGIDLYKDDGSKNTFEVWIQKSTASDDMVNTGVVVSPSYSGSMQSNKGKVYFEKISIETTEGVSVNNYDEDVWYLQGQEVEFTANVAQDYTFGGWQVGGLAVVEAEGQKQVQETFADFTGSGELTITITVHGATRTTSRNYKVSATHS